MSGEFGEASRMVETLFNDAGWAVEPGSAMDGRVVREFRVGQLVLDYALFVKNQLVGVVEVKSLLSQAAARQAHELGARLNSANESSRLFPSERPPAIYLTNGHEILVVTDDAPPREVASFHSPAALTTPAGIGGLAREVAALPSEIAGQLHDFHVDAIAALERSLAAGERRALVAMPTGGGRTSILLAETDRLLRHTSVERVLVLVDRRDVAAQLADAFRRYEAEGREFGQDYEVDVPSTSEVSPRSNVVVMTVQRLAAMLERTGEAALPVDYFDFIWALDPERLAGRAWERFLDYFDAPLVGITTTPTPESFAFFDGNLVAQLDVAELLREPVPQTDETKLAEVFRLLDRAWAEGRRPEDALVRLLDERDVELGWRELARLIHRLGSRILLAPAEFLLDFLADYFRGRNAEWVVDPSAANPTLLQAVVDAGAAKQALGLVPSRFAFELTRGLREDPRVSWTEADLLHDAEAAAEIGRPDIIVSAPPIGARVGRGQLRLDDGRELTVRDDAGHLLLLQTASQLGEEGEAVFLVSNAFFRTGAGRVRSLLGEAGLHVHSVLGVRQGLPGVQIPVSLVFIRRRPVERMFVAELSPDIEREQLLSQLMRRRRGPVAALGRLVPWEGFEGFDQVASAERAELLAAEMPGNPVKLTEVLSGPIARPRKDEDFEPASNAVYLPTFASSLVHQSREELTSKPWGYYQLPLNPSLALAEYVTPLLNSRPGRALRESIASRSGQRSISRAALEELQLPLPDISAQQAVVAVRARIGALRVELDAFEARLSSDPASAGAVASALDELGATDPLASFREALPFPLASILWRYEADAQVREKVSHLHGFFEACAIFFAAVLLSAFTTDEDLHKTESAKWFSKLRPNSFDRSNFGTFTLFGQLMAKSARKLLEDPPQRQRMVDAFKVRSDLFADTIASHELWGILDEAKDIRNTEKGHSGIAGEEQHARTHAMLSALLTRLGVLLRPCLGDTMLIRPREMRYRRGVAYYDRAELLQGRDDIFLQTAVATLSGPLEATELYLFPTAETPASAALHVEPFFRLKAAPRTAHNACYFYAGLKDGSVELISHHFEGAPRIQERDEDVIALIGRLHAPEPGLE